MDDDRPAPCTLTQSVDEQTLREIQDGLACFTRSTVGIVGGHGRLLLPPSCGAALGAALAETPDGATAQVARIQAAAARCPDDRESWSEDDGLGLEYLSVPISAARCRLGTLVMGERPARRWTREHAAGLADRWHLDLEALWRAAEDLPAYTEAERRGAVCTGRVLAGVISRMCLQEQQLQDRIEELSAVYDLADMLTGSRSLQEMLHRIARTVCEVMQTKACSIRLLDEQTGELVIKAVHNLSERYLKKGPVHVLQNSIDMHALQGRIQYIADVPNDPRVRYPEDARQEGIASGLVCGMIYRGKPVGVIRVYTGRPHRFSNFEQSLLRAVANQAAVAIVNAKLYEAALESERQARQLRYAGEVQRRMIPAAPPRCAEATFGCLYKPSREVGGDFYDFIELPGRNLGIAIADVVGKGIPASLTMASLRSALRVYAYHVYDIERIVAQVNNHLCRDTRSSEFATLFYGVLTPDGRRLTYCNAGHEPPLLLRDGRIELLDTGGPVIGVKPDETFQKGVLELARGDVVLLYTDGVVESMNFAGEEFGRARLRESLQRYGSLEPSQLVHNILWDVRRFIGFSDLADDMTMVVFRIR